MKTSATVGPISTGYENARGREDMICFAVPATVYTAAGAIFEAEEISIATKAVFDTAKMSSAAAKPTIASPTKVVVASVSVQPHNNYLRKRQEATTSD